VSQLRCAIYARYSTDKQNPLSIDDQIRKCREFAARNGWEVLDAHIYGDEAICGATDDRSGLKNLLGAATAAAHPIDVILVDDTSRLSRKLADSLRIFDQLRFSGVRLIFVSQGIDTDSEQAEVLLATHGIVDSLYIQELAKKTHRGVEGRALQGFHTGGPVLRLSQRPHRGSNANRHLRPSANRRSETRGSSGAGGYRPKNLRRLRRWRFSQNYSEEAERRGRDIAGTAPRSAPSVMGAVGHLRDAAQRALPRNRGVEPDAKGARSANWPAGSASSPANGMDRHGRSSS